MVDADDRDILEMQGSKITPNANLTMYQKTSAVYGDAANNAKVRAVNAEAPRHYICGIFGFGSKPVTGMSFIGSCPRAVRQSVGTLTVLRNCWEFPPTVARVVSELCSRPSLLRNGQKRR